MEKVIYKYKQFKLYLVKNKTLSLEIREQKEKSFVKNNLNKRSTVEVVTWRLDIPTDYTKNKIDIEIDNATQSIRNSADSNIDTIYGSYSEI